MYGTKILFKFDGTKKMMSQSGACLSRQTPGSVYDKIDSRCGNSPHRQKYTQNREKT